MLEITLYSSQSLNKSSPVSTVAKLFWFQIEAKLLPIAATFSLCIFANTLTYKCYIATSFPSLQLRRREYFRRHTPESSVPGSVAWILHTVIMFGLSSSQSDLSRSTQALTWSMEATTRSRSWASTYLGPSQPVADRTEPGHHAAS